MAGSGTAHLHDAEDVLLRAEHVVVQYRSRSGAAVQAVTDVSIDIRRGETLGLVGESGCGKSTLGRALLALPRPTSGRVVFDGHDLTAMRSRDVRRLRPRFQVIFQDPISSLNPRRRVRNLVAQGAMVWDKAKGTSAKVAEVMTAVGLDVDLHGDRRPYEFSGGQCQRIAIARALLLEPDLLICDEPVSALDVSVQAQILNLLEDMKARYGLSMLFIAHDLAVVKNISDRVAVMYLGKLCEVAPADGLYAQPAHPYTRALLDAVPEPDPEATNVPLAIEGDLPSPINPPSGCRFRTRCPRAQDLCAEQEPIMRPVSHSQFVACHFPLVDVPVAIEGGAPWAATRS